MTEQVPPTGEAATTLEVTVLPDEIAKRLEERAREAGAAPGDYARDLLIREMGRPALDEILAPIRQGFAESGLTEEELTSLFEEAREEVVSYWPVCNRMA